MNNSKEHQELCSKILLAVGSLPNVRLWKRDVALAVPYARLRRLLESFGVIREIPPPISFGMEGECDLDGIIMRPLVLLNGKSITIGQRVGIEVKTGAGRLSEEQRRWRDMILRFGGHYVEARCVEDALKSVKSVLE